MLCVWIRRNWSIVFCSWHTKLHTTSHNEEKKNPELLAQDAHSSIAKANTQKKNSLPFLTQHLNVTAEAGQPFIGIDVKRRSHCATPSVGEGRGGLYGRPARCEVHLCGRGCGARPLRLWRRWISYRCPCQHGPITNQMQKRARGAHTDTTGMHKHKCASVNNKHGVIYSGETITCSFFIYSEHETSDASSFSAQFL